MKEMPKKRIIGVILLLVAFVALFSNKPVYAEDGTCNSVKGDQYYGKEDFFKEDGNSVVVKPTHGKFNIYYRETTIKSDGKHEQGSIKETSVNGDKGESKKLSYSVNKGETTFFEVLVVLGESDEYCSVHEFEYVDIKDEKGNTVKGTWENNFSGIVANTIKQDKVTYFSYTVEKSGPHEATDYDNNSIKAGGICYKFVNGVWDADKFTGIQKEDFDKYNPNAISSKSGNCGPKYYEKNLTYCYKEKVPIIYQDNIIATMIKYSISGYKQACDTSGSSDVDTPFGEWGTIPSDHNFSYDKNPEKVNISLRCSPFKLGGDKEYEYPNKEVYFTHSEYSRSYTLPHSRRTLKCTRNCSETLRVSYGAPVAVKGGICLSYQVKVESIVKCDTNFQGTPPQPSEYTVCEPQAHCDGVQWSYGAYTGSQAGPNEDFDNCILKCDGGKYTQNCINKCYKEVYTGSKGITNNINIGGTKLMSCDYSGLASNNWGGEYYRCGGQTTGICWRNTSGCYWANYARYYTKYEWSRTVHDDAQYGGGGDYRGGFLFKYYPDGNGIKRGETCNETCYYVGCESGYLNEQEAIQAYREDLQAYDAALSDCTAQDGCSTTAATFTISINNKVTDKTGDNIVSYGTASLQPHKDGSAIFNGNTNIIIDNNYCYATQAADTDKYLAEWHIPGTWENRKTHEFAYGDKPDGNGWKYHEGLFCTSLKTADTNTEWWDYIIYGKSDLTETQINDSIKDWNISAATKNFGKYNWNINIGCFYASKDPTTDEDVPNEPYDPDDPGRGIAYRIRTVTNNDLFPLSEAGKSNTNDQAAGRTPGFNWTESATNIKNPQYRVMPELLIADIQTKGNDVFREDLEDENLDYEFVLDREALRRIKNYRGHGSYDNYQGEVEVVNGVYAYSSKLFRGVGSVLDSKYIRKLGTIGCNNEINGSCYNFNGAEE